MGQPITITATTVDGVMAAFHTDRGITGQDGVSFESAEVAEGSASMPGDLASRMFGSDDALDHVFIASNQVVARRVGGWDAGSLTAASSLVEAFFVFYADA